MEIGNGNRVALAKVEWYMYYFNQDSMIESQDEQASIHHQATMVSNPAKIAIIRMAITIPNIIKVAYWQS